MRAATAVCLVGCGAPPTLPPTPSQAAVGQVSDGSGRPAADADGGVQALRFDDMETERADPAPGQRNPFRFGAGRAPVSFDAPSVPDAPVDRDGPSFAWGERVALAPVGVPPPPAAIPLTFLGFVESPGIDGRVVIFSDGDNTFYGRRGEVVDGRYRIVSLGLESVDVERIDGGGRTTLTLPNDASDGV